MHPRQAFIARLATNAVRPYGAGGDTYTIIVAKLCKVSVSGPPDTQPAGRDQTNIVEGEAP